MNVLVTGVAGFIGSNLADRLLAEGHDVVGIDNLSYGPREQVPPGVRFIEADIRDRAIDRYMTGTDVIFHLAAKNCISDCQLDAVETSDINVTGTANLFESAVRAGVKRIVYAESSALYEGSTVFPTPESDVAPRSFYAISKASGMLFAEGFARFHGLQTTALRYFCVYGPRQDYRRTIPPVMSAFIIKLLRGQQPVIYGSGKKRRDFVYVDDINDFHVQCLGDSRTIGRVFNLGSGENHSVREIYATISTLLGLAVEPEYRSDLPGEAEENLADITAARSLGWRPRTSLEQGLRSLIDYIRTNAIVRA